MTAQLLTAPLTTIQARSTADIRGAVLTARTRSLPFAVEATGHGAHGSFDEGVLLNTSAMNQVTIDPKRRTAQVGPGTRWADVITAAAEFDLAPVSGSSLTVGVTGFTVGGGVGWLARKYGFAADNVLKAEVVTADGELLTASPEHNTDLFWAIRGGGGNFGVVTSLEFRLHPLREGFGGVAYFPLNRATEVLEQYGDWVADRPEELTANVALMSKSPIDGAAGPIMGIRVFYGGPADQAATALRPLFGVAGEPVADNLRPMRYTESGTIGGTAPRQFSMFADLSDAVIERAVESVSGDQPRAAAIEVRLWGGAMARPDAAAGPVGHRQVQFSLTIDGPSTAAAPFAPYATGGSFLNWLHDTSRTPTAFTAFNYRRLRKIKAAYDSDQLFRRGHNIPPAL